MNPKNNPPEIPVKQDPHQPNPEKTPQDPNLDPSKSNPRNPREDTPPNRK